jgi:cobalamin biosynthesis protein CobT
VEKGMDMLENKCRRAGERYTYPHWTDDTKGHRALANQIRQYIQAKRRTKWQKERKTGRQLNKRCLSRLATGTGEYNKRVFQQRIDHKDLNTAIMVLVDWSGSMGGTKAFYANLSAQRMSAVFSDALGIPLKIMTHTSAGTSMHDGNPRLIFGTVKDWDDKRPAPKAIADRFIRAAHCRMGANADADALMMARHELMKRPEARKILIILSDGLPSLSYVNSDSRAASNSYAISGAAAKVMLKDCVKELAADGNIDFYAIGLQTRGLDQYYGDGNVQTVMEDTDLSAVLLKTMRDCVIKPEKL